MKKFRTGFVTGENLKWFDFGSIYAPDYLLADENEDILSLLMSRLSGPINKIMKKNEIIEIKKYEKDNLLAY